MRGAPKYLVAAPGVASPRWGGAVVGKGRRESGGRAGFTLIELLTVIGIMAILATLLMTGLSAAKQKARTVKCTSNLRQIALALNMYMDDWEKRPGGYAPLFTGNYLIGAEAVLCPEDRSGRWGNLVLPRAGREPIAEAIPGVGAPAPQVDNPAARSSGLGFSYLHPMAWPDPIWREIRSFQGNAGISSCQLHGLGEMDLETPNLHDFEGLLLRAQFDGAVVRRHLYWDSRSEAEPPSSADESANFEGSAPTQSSTEYPIGFFVDTGQPNTLTP